MYLLVITAEKTGKDSSRNGFPWHFLFTVSVPFNRTTNVWAEDHKQHSITRPLSLQFSILFSFSLTYPLFLRTRSTIFPRTKQSSETNVYLALKLLDKKVSCLNNRGSNTNKNNSNQDLQLSTDYAWLIINLIFTDRIRRMGESNVFSLFTWGGGGTQARSDSGGGERVPQTPRYLPPPAKLVPLPPARSGWGWGYPKIPTSPHQGRYPLG